MAGIFLYNGQGKINDTDVRILGREVVKALEKVADGRADKLGGNYVEIAEDYWNLSIVNHFEDHWNPFSETEKEDE